MSNKIDGLEYYQIICAKLDLLSIVSAEYWWLSTQCLFTHHLGQERPSITFNRTLVMQFLSDLHLQTRLLQ